MRTQDSDAIVNCSSLGGLIGLTMRRRRVRVQGHPDQLHLPRHDRHPMVADMLEGQSEAMAEIMK